MYPGDPHLHTTCVIPTYCIFLTLWLTSRELQVYQMCIVLPYEYVHEPEGEFIWIRCPYDDTYVHGICIGYLYQPCTFQSYMYIGFKFRSHQVTSEILKDPQFRSWVSKKVHFFDLVSPKLESRYAPEEFFRPTNQRHFLLLLLYCCYFTRLWNTKGKYFFRSSDAISLKIFFFFLVNTIYLKTARKNRVFLNTLCS